MNDVLHIYGQGAWHNDIRIVGTKDALQKFSDALIKCLKEKKSEFQTFVNDGEGYSIIIKCVEEESPEFDEMPYSEDYAK